MKNFLSSKFFAFEAIADIPEHDNHAFARVQLQIMDVDEQAPRFESAEPEFHIRMPLVAGQPIGRVRVRDDDFSDRHPGALIFRAISGEFMLFILHFRISKNLVAHKLSSFLA